MNAGRWQCRRAASFFHHFGRFDLLPLGIVAGLALAGCSGSSAAKVAPESQQKLQRIAGAYARANAELNRPPNSLEELLPYLKTGQEDSADLLMSPEDGEEYVIVWGVDFAKIAASGQDPKVVFAYEKTGKGGRRHVLIHVSRVSVMNQAEFQKAPFPPGHQPSI